MLKSSYSKFSILSMVVGIGKRREITKTRLRRRIGAIEFSRENHVQAELSCLTLEAHS